LQKHAQIHVTGIVQGVGFRPFIFRVATSLSLHGYVMNLGDAGVRIVVEGGIQDIEQLVHLIRKKPPSISRIDRIDIKWIDKIVGYTEFRIAKSSSSRAKEAVSEIPPDIAICDDCVQDLLQPSSRWYLYPFTSCAACGPRFSTITSLPYDRPNTTMDDFPLCNTCNIGYTNGSSLPCTDYGL
jgi:hydrogenase maturation protein HypF